MTNRTPQRDAAAFKRRLLAAGAAGLVGPNGQPLERREAPTLDALNTQINAIASAVEGMRQKNDQAIAQMEKRGTVDAVTADELKKMKDEVIALRDVRSEMEALRLKMGRPQANGRGQEITKEQREHRTALLGYLRNPNSRSAQDRLELAERGAMRADEAAALEFETRAVATNTDAAGGHAVPEILAAQIQQNLIEMAVMRNLVSVITVGTRDYKELVDKRGTSYGWVGETDARAETNTAQLDQLAPTFGTLYAYPRATEESLTDMFFDVEAWLTSSVVEAFKQGEENAIVNGNGTNKPTGFLTGTPVATSDASRAFGVLQYIATGVAATWKATTPLDTFQQTIYTLKKGYRENARWLMNKATAGQVMLFKDVDNRYMWQPSVLEGQPDRLLGYPVSESEEMPDVAANAFGVAFGDFKAGYLLCDLVGQRITRDDVTTPGYVKWYVRRRLGGKIRKSEAIKLIKFAIS